MQNLGNIARGENPMRRWLMFNVVALLLVIGTGQAGDKGRADPIQQELKGLQGVWKMEGYEYEGKRLSRKAAIKAWGGEDQLPDLRIEGDKITWVGPHSTEYTPLAGGKPKPKTYSLNPKKSQKTVDLHYLASGFLGGQSLGTLRGIYRIKGDRLEVCCRPDSRKEEDRPKDFTTDDNDSDRLVIYKRVKGTAK